MDGQGEDRRSEGTRYSRLLRSIDYFCELILICAVALPKIGESCRYDVFNLCQMGAPVHGVENIFDIKTDNSKINPDLALKMCTLTFYRYLSQ